MNLPLVFNYLGWFLFNYSFVFLSLLIPAFIYGENHLVPVIFQSFFVVLCLGGLGIVLTMRRKTDAEEELYQREALCLVGLGWITVTVLGGLPYLLSLQLSLIDSVFESISGFTTTGATTVQEIETFPKTLLFWRALTHFMGGVGIVVIFISVLPYLGVGGRLLMESETSAPDMRFIKPRIRETAKQILIVYISLTVFQIVLLVLFGMNLFEAVCHSFATLSTGGFSTRQLSIESFNSVPIELTTVFFMLCGATNFGLMYQLCRGKVLTFIRNTEWQVYIAFWLISVLVVTLALVGVQGEFKADQSPVRSNLPLTTALRYSVFTVTSLLTSTGFTNTDYDTWPYIARWWMTVMVIIGGCAGSTCGGIKIIRFVIVCKYLKNRIYGAFQPRTVKTVKVGEQIISEEIQRNVVGFFLLWLWIMVLGSVMLTWTGLPIVTAISASVVCLGNVGPGLEFVGGYECYADVPTFAKIVLSLLMLLGRLELYSILVLFIPAFWKRQ